MGRGVPHRVAVFAASILLSHRCVPPPSNGSLVPFVPSPVLAPRFHSVSDPADNGLSASPHSGPAHMSGQFSLDCTLFFLRLRTANGTCRPCCPPCLWRLPTIEHYSPSAALQRCRLRRRTAYLLFVAPEARPRESALSYADVFSPGPDQRRHRTLRSMTGPRLSLESIRRTTAPRALFPTLNFVAVSKTARKICLGASAGYFSTVRAPAPPIRTPRGRFCRLTFPAVAHFAMTCAPPPRQLPYMTCGSFLTLPQRLTHMPPPRPIATGLVGQPLLFRLA